MKKFFKWLRNKKAKKKNTRKISGTIELNYIIFAELVNIFRYSENTAESMKAEFFRLKKQHDLLEKDIEETVNLIFKYGDIFEPEDR